MNPDNVSEHSIGFEREKLFNDVLWDVSRKFKGFKSSDLKEILRLIAPEFLDGLYEFRPCKRKLVYVGDKYCGCAEQIDDHHFFRIGVHYYSEAFCGGSYLIEGFDDGPIGCGYFEVIEDLTFELLSGKQGESQ